MKCYNVFMPIRGHIAILLTAVAFAAFARKATMPQLSAPAFADTEVVTNMPMPSVDMATRRVSFSLAFAATPSNCVEAVFGTDHNGDGELSPGERRLAVGWRCGRWFVRKSPDSESSADVPMAADGSETALSWKMRLSPVRRDRVAGGVCGWLASLHDALRRAAAVVARSGVEHGAPARMWQRNSWRVFQRGHIGRRHDVLLQVTRWTR